MSEYGKIETRTYDITADKVILDNLERVFALMQHLGNVGHSSRILLMVDGDGACRPKFSNIDIRLTDDEKKETLPIDIYPGSPQNKFYRKVYERDLG